MLSYEYHKRVKEYANQHSISIERARSEIGKRGAETRKRKAAKKKNQEYQKQFMYLNLARGKKWIS